VAAAGALRAAAVLPAAAADPAADWEAVRFLLSWDISWVTALPRSTLVTRRFTSLCGSTRLSFIYNTSPALKHFIRLGMRCRVPARPGARLDADPDSVLSPYYFDIFVE
jgi:hypothetical protein